MIVIAWVWICAVIIAVGVFPLGALSFPLALYLTLKWRKEQKEK